MGAGCSVGIWGTHTFSPRHPLTTGRRWLSRRRGSPRSCVRRTRSRPCALGSRECISRGSCQSDLAVRGERWEGTIAQPPDTRRNGTAMTCQQERGGSRRCLAKERASSCPLWSHGAGVDGAQVPWSSHVSLPGRRVGRARASDRVNAILSPKTVPQCLSGVFEKPRTINGNQHPCDAEPSV